MGRYTNDQQTKPKSIQNQYQHAHSQIDKVTHSFPQTHHYDEEDSSTPVLVYLHSHTKKSLKLQLSPIISITEVKNIIEQNIGIKKDRQLLYLNGKNITQYGNIRLQPRSIIHISNSDEICYSSQEINLKLTIINYVDQNQQKTYKKCTALSTDRVSDFLLRFQKQINDVFKFKEQNVQYYLLESSRLLNKEKTFLEQDVTRQSDIICMITKNELKTRFTNDTKQEILHDISELLGFSDETENIPQPKDQENVVRPRYSREQIKSQHAQKQTCQEQSFKNASSQQFPNFKKKKISISQASPFYDTPNTSLASKLKSSKKKKDLDLLLNSQQKQKLLSQSTQAIKQKIKIEEVRIQQAQIKEKVISEAPKLTPQIPKAMPVNERKQIRLEIQKLFNLGNSQKAKPLNSVQNSDTKEQKKPISPPTEVPKQKQKMRLSMGSRPAFLAQLRNMNLQ